MKKDDDYLKNIEEFRKSHEDFFNKPLSEKRTILETHGKYLFTIKSKNKYESPIWVFKLFNFWVEEYHDFSGRHIHFSNVFHEDKEVKRGKRFNIIMWSVFICLFLILPAYAYISASNKGLIPTGSVYGDFSAMLYQLRWVILTIKVIVKLLYFVIMVNFYLVLVLAIIIGIPIFLYEKIKEFIKKRNEKT